MVTVGIPRALSYYRYFPLWKTLLESLGAEVVVSDPTGKQILEQGVRHCVDDICVPVKLYYGHVLDLKDRVDYLFVQRLVSIEKCDCDTYTCPKLMGLPDMIKSSLDGLPPFLEFTLDIKKRTLSYTARRMARPLSVRPSEVRRGLKEALEVQARYEGELLGGKDPHEAMSSVLGSGQHSGNGMKRRGNGGGRGTGDVNVAIVGHEYMIHDGFISHDLPGKLAGLGANVTYMTQVPPEIVEQELAKYPDMSWSYEKVLLGATSHFLDRDDIHGVLMVMGFACGPDSIITEIIEREVRKDGSPPLMTLVLDEHTGEAGITTRVEAFVDLVRRGMRQ